MARNPRKNRETPTSSLLVALQFIGTITKEIGPPTDTHVHLCNRWATAFNGVVAAGHKIEEDIYAFAHNQRMIDALSKCGQNLSITQLDHERIAIKSERFKATVPCLDPTPFEPPIPDPPIAVINDALRAGINAVGVLASEQGLRVIEQSVLILGQSVIATTGAVILEFWHGIDLPPGIAIPKAFEKALAKTGKTLTHFGFSKSSVTLYFNDGSWLRTQLFAEEWPRTDHILNKPTHKIDLPTDFYKALDAIKPFATDGLVYFDNNLMRTKDGNASYEVEGIQRGPIFSIKQLETVKPYVKQVDFFAPGPYPGTTMMIFTGDNIRGWLMPMKGE
jgi:hypothetical protein